MSNVARNHKDNVFCLLYRDKGNLLSLYNAVNNTSYADEEELEVVTLEASVSQAVEECIAEGILAGFFRERREEIVEMGIYEFDQELHDRVLREDGEAIGMEKGMEIGRSEGMAIAICVYRKIQAGEADDQIIAKSCGCTVEEVTAIRKQLE